MALTKLPKNAFGTGSVDDSKIEDGTIQNVELEDGTLSSEKFTTGTIENASLSNSTITINGTSISLGGSSSVGVDVNWQSVQTTGFTAVAGNGYFVDTTSGAITVTLPASATLGDQIAIKDYAGTFASNNLTIGRNGHNIQGVANDSLISTNRASLLLVYVDSTKGWIYAEESNVADLQGPTFITATGGTITESGDYKIHTFTGDGCFVVSTLGNGPTYSGGPSTVSYLVIAGGAGGGKGSGSNAGGGGGAGGFREGRDITPAYTASPLVAPTGLTISATTYPVTVGGGGGAGSTGGPGLGCSGSNSIFSTITSTGGGGGGGGTSLPGPCTAGSGGSGGGTRGSVPSARVAGSGNTPPVSPPQGNPGGSGPTGDIGGGGGGGATATGGSSPGFNTGGAGGNGATTSISGTSSSYSGGAGGGALQGGGTGGSGGTGGGGAGGAGPYPNGSPKTDSTAGTANTGGGGGGAGGSSSPGGLASAGGKGIVIIRYKFQ